MSSFHILHPAQPPPPPPPPHTHTHTDTDTHTHTFRFSWTKEHSNPLQRTLCYILVSLSVHFMIQSEISHSPPLASLWTMTAVRQTAETASRSLRFVAWRPVFRRSVVRCHNMLPLLRDERVAVHRGGRVHVSQIRTITPIQTCDRRPHRRAPNSTPYIRINQTSTGLHVECSAFGRIPWLNWVQD